MATNYPAALDTYVALADNVDDVLAAHTNDRGDAIEQLEIKIGVDGSAVNTAFDYFLKHAAGAYRIHKHDGTADDGSATIGPLAGISLANNVDMGNYQVRAKQFYADIPTGTAPFVVSSTTKVANLNAERVDNLHLPATVADLLTNHDKALHDALNIAINLANAVNGPLTTLLGGTGVITPLISSITYTGNGVDNRDMAHGLGTDPDFIIVVALSSGSAPQLWIRGIAAGKTKSFDGTLWSGNLIQSVDGTNVQLGTDAYVNGNGVTYSMICIVAQIMLSV